MYWKDNADGVLSQMDPAKTLAEQLPHALARSRSPIWMDSSTSQECAELEALAGSPEHLAAVTGSRAYERFTGNQIARLLKRGDTSEEGGDALLDLGRISLISSFGCSLLAGKVAPIDLSDGSGMNLLDIRGPESKDIRWMKEALGACVARPGNEDADLASLASIPVLAGMLGDPVPSHAQVAGRTSEFCQQRYGFGADVTVSAWSGDNPNSVAGLRLSQAGEIAVSLGTSDTMFGIAKAADAEPGLEGHVFVSPSDPSDRMMMLCYKNGSLTRQRIRDMYADGDWAAFGAALERT